MKTAIGIFGFIRRLDVDINRFVQKIPDGDIDVYVCCPDQLGEFADTPVSNDQIRSIFTHPRIKSVNISMFKYQPGPFIDKVESCGIPHFLPHFTYFTYRVVSLIHSMTKLGIFMKDVEADTFILTRVDMIPNIHNFGECFNNIEPSTAYIWRTYPFPDPGYAEDRVIISGKNLVASLVNYYDNFPVDDYNFISEYTLGKYLKVQPNIVMLPQTGIYMENPLVSDKKNTREFIQQVINIINDYKAH